MGSKAWEFLVCILFVSGLGRQARFLYLRRKFWFRWCSHLAAGKVGMRVDGSGLHILRSRSASLGWGLTRVSSARMSGCMLPCRRVCSRSVLVQWFSCGLGRAYICPNYLLAFIMCLYVVGVEGYGILELEKLCEFLKLGSWGDFVLMASNSSPSSWLLWTLLLQ